MSEEEQVFFTEEGDETEEHYWERKRLSEKGHKVDETVIQIDAIPGNNVDEITNFNPITTTNQSDTVEASKRSNFAPTRSKNPE